MYGDPMAKDTGLISNEDAATLRIAATPAGRANTFRVAAARTLLRLHDWIEDGFGTGGGGKASGAMGKRVKALEDTVAKVTSVEHVDVAALEETLGGITEDLHSLSEKLTALEEELRG